MNRMIMLIRLQERWRSHTALFLSLVANKVGNRWDRISCGRASRMYGAVDVPRYRVVTSPTAQYILAPLQMVSLRYYCYVNTTFINILTLTYTFLGRVTINSSRGYDNLKNMSQFHNAQRARAHTHVQTRANQLSNKWIRANTYAHTHRYI